MTPGLNPMEATGDHVVSNILSYLKEHSADSYDYVARVQFERLIFSARYIENSCQKSDAIVDVGSFPYFIPAYLSLKGFQNVITVETPRPDEFTRDPSWKFQRLTCDIEESPLPLKDNSVDAVVMLQVFEHLYRRPNQVFREFRRVLRPGGKIIMSTPNGARLGTYAKILLRRQFGLPIFKFSEDYERYGHFSHIREYSVQEITAYLAHFDFVIECTLHRSFRPLVCPYESRLGKFFYALNCVVQDKLFFLPILQNGIFVVARNRK